MDERRRTRDIICLAGNASGRLQRRLGGVVAKEGPQFGTSVLPDGHDDLEVADLTGAEVALHDATRPGDAHWHDGGPGLPPSLVGQVLAEPVDQRLALDDDRFEIPMFTRSGRPLDQAL